MSQPRRLPIVDDSFMDNVRVATPCEADWSQMQGDDRVRHCSDCRLNVYDVSQMTRAEAATLIRMNEGKRVCMRLYRRPDGTLITQDCWERLRAARRRGWVAFAAALVIVGLTQLGLRLAALNWLMKVSGETPPVTLQPPIVETTTKPPCPLPTPEIAQPIITGGAVTVAPEPVREMGKVAPPTRKPKTPPVKKPAAPSERPTPLMGDIAIDE